jgi:PAS domain-containing protein
MKSESYLSERKLRLFVGRAIFWVFALLLLVTRGAQASEIWLFEDTSGSKTYDEVMANPHWFEPTTDTSRGFSDSVFWIKQTLTNPFSTPLTQVVQFDSLRLPRVEEFLKVDSGTRLRSNGYLIPLAGRPSSQHHTSFPIELEPFSTTEVLYRIESQFKVDLGYQVLDQNAALRANFKILLIGALILGSLLLLVTYNAILALLDRSRVYGYYVGFLVSISLATLAFFRLYEPFGVVMDTVYLEASSGVALYAFAYLFLSQLFKTSQTKTTQRLLNLGYLVLGGHLLLEPYAMMKSYADWAGPIIVFVFTYLVINAWIKRDPLAKFVMLGWSVYAVCSLLYVANLKGIVGPEFEYVLSLGNLFEGVVLSGVLAYRLLLANQTEMLLKAAQVELQRERLANEIGYGYKWEFDVERQMIRPDETFAAWHGMGWQAGEWYPAEEIFAAVPEEWHAWLAEDMRKGVDSAMADPAHILQSRHPLIRNDIGETIWIQVYGKLLDVDGRKLLVGNSIDVTELVESKQAVDAEIEKFEEVSERATLLFWRLNLDTQQISYNKTFAKLWSLEPGGTILYQDWRNLQSTAIAQLFSEAINEVIATQAPVKRVFETQLTHLHGQWHRAQLFPVFNERNELISVDCLNTDLTELMHTQTQLESTITKQKELFAIVGHELRTPVATIKMLTEDEQVTERERTRQIADISESLLNVLDDMRVVIAPERIGS